MAQYYSGVAFHYKLTLVRPYIDTVVVVVVKKEKK